MPSVRRLDLVRWLVRPLLPERHLRWGSLVHVHLILQKILLDPLSRLYVQQLQTVLRKRRNARLLLPNSLRPVWRLEHRLVSLCDVLGSVSLRMNIGREIGFVMLGLTVGIVALWSP